ncbi:hypothetical protein [Arcticibacter sp. MXS-1]|uniref:hypothetical protein n=1 Tax=Arcticibacter sp. MXS-1 TaxID=3341726 RepID=UPI0035A963E4
MKPNFLYSALMLFGSAALVSSCSQGKVTEGQQRTAVADSGNAEASKGREARLSSRTDSVWLLVPARSAGQTKLNAKTEELVKRLGKPDGGDAAMGKTVSVWFNDHDSLSNSLSVYSVRSSPPDESYKIRQIRVTSPAFKTPEGLHTGSPIGEIRRAYPLTKTESYKDKGKRYALYDSEQGIAFEVGPDSSCVAIIIHEKGLDRQTTYLKFRTTG